MSGDGQREMVRVRFVTETHVTSSLPNNRITNLLQDSDHLVARYYG